MLPLLLSSLLIGTASVSASVVAFDSLPLEKRACPQVHVFGARETTVAQGYGTSGPVVNSILANFPGSTSEAIVYPACGGQSSCGGVSYANSVIQGVSAVASQVNAFNQQCPSTILALVGYSQGGQIFDDAYCGGTVPFSQTSGLKLIWTRLCSGGDTNEGLSSTAIPISTAAQAKIAAAIFMGDPRHIPGLSYNVGTCQASGVCCSFVTAYFEVPWNLVATDLHFHPVRSPPRRLRLPLCLEHPVLLRRRRSLLLQRQRRQHSPRVCE